MVLTPRGSHGTKLIISTEFQEEISSQTWSITRKTLGSGIQALHDTNFITVEYLLYRLVDLFGFCT